MKSKEETNKTMFRFFKEMWNKQPLERDIILLGLAKDIKNNMVNRLVLVNIIEFLAEAERTKT